MTSAQDTGNTELRGIEAWVAPIEKSLASHPEGAGYYDICWDTGASVATMLRVLEWLERAGRVESFGDPRRYRKVT